MMAQNTEAPSEMMFYFPDKKALCLSEVATKLMHNIYTIRGAKVRDSLVLEQVHQRDPRLYPDAEVAFASHHWPTWGNANIRQFLANQRDTYRFMHDRATEPGEQGETMKEIGNASFFPKGLAADASSHGYYGTLSHNLRAVYNYYLGFYDGNPATLDPLLPGRCGQTLCGGHGRRGGCNRESGSKAVADGDYRWAVETGESRGLRQSGQH